MCVGRSIYTQGMYSADMAAKRKTHAVVLDTVSPEEFSRRQTAKLHTLTERFLVLKNQLQRDAVETIREMGDVLDRGAELLPHGWYGKWVDEALKIGRSAATNYRRVAELSRSTPAIFLDAKKLGKSKVIRLARVEPQQRKAALRQTVAGRGTIEMTDAEFSLALRKFVKKQRPVTGNMRAHGLRMKLHAMNATLHKAMRHPRAASPAMRAGLRKDLAEIIARARKLRAKAC